jgi:ABC-type multidrug transport system ATPase subunit
MRRRLDLGASLVGRPPIILLDEPTTGLDPRSRQELWRLVSELRGEGTTVLLTTQYLDEADRLAQRIAVMDRGKIVAQGTPSELKAKLGSEILSVRLADAARAAEAAELLEDLAPGELPSVDGATGEIRLSVGDPRASADAIRRLDAHDLTVAAVALEQPSLDDVFLALTGRAPEPQDAASTIEEAA